MPSATGAAASWRTSGHELNGLDALPEGVLDPHRANAGLQQRALIRRRDARARAQQRDSLFVFTKPDGEPWHEYD
jgi:hypothetical protein